eukprot:1297908-Prymnesium_polylepis.1
MSSTRDRGRGALLEATEAADPTAWSEATAAQPSPGATEALVEAINSRERLDALTACDSEVRQYDPADFLVIFSCHGRNLPLVIKPLACLLVWGL